MAFVRGTSRDSDDDKADPRNWKSASILPPLPKALESAKTGMYPPIGHVSTMLPSADGSAGMGLGYNPFITPILPIPNTNRQTPHGHLLPRYPVAAASLPHMVVPPADPWRRSPWQLPVGAAPPVGQSPLSIVPFNSSTPAQGQYAPTYYANGIPWTSATGMPTHGVYASALRAPLPYAGTLGGPDYPERLSKIFSAPTNRMTRALLSRPFARRVVDDTLDLILTRSLIPGMIIDAFIEVDRERHRKGVASHHTAQTIQTSIVNDVIKDATYAVVKETISDLVKSHMMHAGFGRSPAYVVCNDIIQSTVSDVTTAIAKETISELAQAHMHRVRHEGAAETIVMAYVWEACKEDAADVIAEQHKELLLWSVYGDVVAHNVLAVSRECLIEEGVLQERQQLQQVLDFGSSALLDGLVLESVLRHYGANDEDLLMKYHTNHFMEGLLMEALLGRHSSLQDNVSPVPR